MLLLPHDALDARRAIARGALAPLAASLAADLARVLAADPAPDPRKARMTRTGGRCARDGTLLGFDPFAPHEHRCPACGATHVGDDHDRWGLMWHHLWLAERTVHAAVLHLLVGHAGARDFAARTLERWAALYLAYPNRDNVLGPTRPFFSTYLESIWLLQLCVALDALEAADGPSPLGATVRDRLVAPSAALIAGYPEGRSNRQVWNAAALLAAARLLGDAAGAERAAFGEGGVASHLAHGLLADGTWYEGENYHQFAHRGLWYGVTLAECAGLPLDVRLRARFDAGFAASFVVALPDLTLPSRRDSQYALSLRQWRYAEMAELGLARGDDARLAGALHALYDGTAAPRRDTGRWRSAAEAERNEPASALSRADLGWRALLHARAELPDARDAAPRSVLLPAQGLAIFRRDGGRRWIALDYGHSGGGHGHPDRLNLLLVEENARILDDVGTGSYVERTLHWYRSTLAHQAPLVDGRSQARVDGELLAHDERDGVGWVAARAEIAPGVRVTRRVVVAEDHLVDVLSWEAERDVVLDLPIHVDAAFEPPLDFAPADPGGAGGLEDGFDFLVAPHMARSPHSLVRLHGAADAWVETPAGAEWWRAVAPGAPGAGPRPFVWVRVRGRRGAIRSVWSTAPLPDAVRVSRDEIVVQRDGACTTHRATATGWRIVRDDGVIELAGHARVVAAETTPAPPPVEPIELAWERPWTRTLGGAHYRRSEESWEAAGRPTAEVTLRATPAALHVAVRVALGRPTTFVAPGSENPLDNERAEINGDGVQLHLRVADGEPAAWLLVPQPGADVRAIPTTPAATAALEATWAPTSDGYAIALRLPLPSAPFALDVLVNEMPPGRERRRGQLVLSGGAGQFVYLQGDRQDPSRLLPVTLPPLAR